MIAVNSILQVPVTPPHACPHDPPHPSRVQRHLRAQRGDAADTPLPVAARAGHYAVTALLLDASGTGSGPPGPTAD